MTDDPPGPATAPCRRCPYRRDARVGLWHVSEYDRMMTYDGSFAEQEAKGATKLYFCQRGLGYLCAGWLTCHGAQNLWALQVHEVDPRTWTFSTDVPVWGSGAEAAAHGTGARVTTEPKTPDLDRLTTAP